MSLTATSHDWYDATYIHMFMLNASGTITSRRIFLVPSP